MCCIKSKALSPLCPGSLAPY